MIRSSLLPCLALVMLAAGPALAERADRDKPVNLEADRVTVDDANKVHVLEGRVTLTQGTLVIRGDRIVVRQDLEGFESGVATGNLARFRVKREGKDAYVEGEAERIEHDTKTEITKFFNRAHVKSGQDEVRGQYIQYDGRAENYVVTSGPGGSVQPGRDSRVRAVIQPKNRKDGAAQANSQDSEPVKLKTAPGIDKPHQE